MAWQDSVKCPRLLHKQATSFPTKSMRWIIDKLESLWPVSKAQVWEYKTPWRAIFGFCQGLAAVTAHLMTSEGTSRRRVRMGQERKTRCQKLGEGSEPAEMTTPTHVFSASVEETRNWRHMQCVVGIYDNWAVAAIAERLESPGLVRILPPLSASHLASICA